MDAFTWFLCAATWMTILVLLCKGFYLRPRLNPPPGPKPWPIIGNFNLIGCLPHRSIHDLSKKYGPLMQLKFGSYPVVVASSTEMAKQILKTHDIIFSDRPHTAAGKYTTYGYNNITWSQYGPYWRQARKICMVEVFSSKRLESFEYIRMEETRALVKSIYNSSGNHISLRNHLYDVNLNIISRIVFGKKYLDEDESETSIVTPNEFKKMLDELFFLNGVLNIGDWIPWTKLMDIHGYVKRMKVIGKKFDLFLEHVIHEHNEKRHGVENWVAKDIVDVLLQLADVPNHEFKLTKTSVKAFSLDMLGGGTETSAVTVEWSISELLKHPETLIKATEELDRVIGRERWVEEKDMPKLPYIEAILIETMRLHPVIPMLVPRLTHENCEIAGYAISAGTRALVSVWTIGRDPSVWDKPEEFWPERFVGKSIDFKGTDDFKLLPFGAGRRMCPGYVLGQKMMQLTLANLIHGFSWKLPENMKPEDLNMEEAFGFTVPKKVPLEAVAEPRLPPHFYRPSSLWTSRVEKNIDLDV